MRRRVLWGLTGIGLALGLVHSGLSLLAWRGGSAEVLWFAGSGLAIVLAGLVNVAMTCAATVDPVQRGTWLVANLLTACFFGLAWTVLPEPQVIVGAVVFSALGVVCVVTRQPTPDARS